MASAQQSGQKFILTWNPSTDSTVVGYVVYYGTNSSNYNTRVDVGTNLTYAITNLQPGLTYYFAVTDYNALTNESAPSMQISLIVPGIVKLRPNALVGGYMLITFPVAPPYSYEIQASTDLKNWVTIGSTGVVTSNMWMGCADIQGSALPHRFYRCVSH
ncbi:MAG TPA: fibronectin type III domain-containing protein [Verrucomicrobiae bacterium]|nr:fibronectin type III domain-containing protein [Verrucomicrobiae bacterium]